MVGCGCCVWRGGWQDDVSRGVGLTVPQCYGVARNTRPHSGIPHIVRRVYINSEITLSIGRPPGLPATQPAVYLPRVRAGWAVGQHNVGVGTIPGRALFRFCWILLFVQHQSGYAKEGGKFPKVKSVLSPPPYCTLIDISDDVGVLTHLIIKFHFISQLMYPSIPA